MALIHFAVTLFVSAFILFLVQPMIGKFVLPKLGGTPQVWNTCMVFFQMVLLLGYFYTHAVSTRLKPRQQVLLHAAVILLPFITFWFFPFWFIRTAELPMGSNPLPATLMLLSVVVGIPFFVVSTTAPLLQKWFGLTGHSAAKDPYFLYGASNLGSMLSLLIYPTLIEPFAILNNQAVIWMASYGVLVLMVFGCIAMIWAPSAAASTGTGAGTRGDGQPHEPPLQLSPAETSAAIAKGAPKVVPQAGALTTPVEEVSLLRRLKWVALAAVPSSFMLGVTSHITTDLSPMPLFWLIPLALYLLSFILVFARWPMVWVEGPHTAMVLLQPIAIALMIFSEVASDDVWLKVAFNVIAFFLTTMVCHGELAKDRPSTRYLTDFYLMMSVGGMVGGMLNALVAPLFPWVFELNLAVIAACLLRPALNFGNWLDGALAGFAEPSAEPQAAKGKGVKAAPSIAKASAPTSGFQSTLDVIVGIGIGILAFVLIFTLVRPDSNGRMPSGTTYLFAYGVPLLAALAFMSRPLRFGLAIAGIIVAHEFHVLGQEGGRILHRSRSYFGVIRVKDSGGPEPYNTLIHGHINHGMNFHKTDDASKDYSRLATTYYHRKGPAGIVMEKYNWFPNPSAENTFWSDARLPAGMVAQGALGALGTGILPTGPLVEAWTEPPYATIGLGTGTMASYGRPFQHCHFYEIDDQIRRLSLPEKGRGKAYFTYLQDALDRGVHVQVLMGDARQRMALPYKNYYEHDKKPGERPNGGPEKFYHMMVVDAFSSDAIPAHLLTKEAFKMYFDHLTDDGILCVHTSNRFVDLPRVVADVAESLDLVAVRGHDNAPQKDKGHFTSEWVMVARKASKEEGGPRAHLKHLNEPDGYRRAFVGGQRANRYWKIPDTHGGKYVWTDDYYNLLNILRLVVGHGED